MSATPAGEAKVTKPRVRRSIRERIAKAEKSIAKHQAAITKQHERIAAMKQAALDRARQYASEAGIGFDPKSDAVAGAPVIEDPVGI